jgi:hypothetical protein
MLKFSENVSMMRNRFLLLIICAIATSFVTVGKAQEVTIIATLSKVESTRTAASKQDKYTFIMFWKNQDDATKVMWNTLQQNLSSKKDKTTFVAVNTNDPTEQNLVKEYGVSRAPMPLTLAIAPNGAITGSFVKNINTEYIDQSFVSPAKSRCMLTLQSRKMVLLCVNPGAKSEMPKGVQDFKSIPCYRDVVNVVSVSTQESGEAGFLKELGVPQQNKGTTVVFMAPPGVMVGQFNANVTQQQLIAELKKAGKSCGVDGCKHCKE